MGACAKLQAYLCHNATWMEDLNSKNSFLFNKNGKK
jgi:hypothetical protein